MRTQKQTMRVKLKQAPSRINHAVVVVDAGVGWPVAAAAATKAGAPQHAIAAASDELERSLLLHDDDCSSSSSSCQSRIVPLRRPISIARSYGHWYALPPCLPACAPLRALLCRTSTGTHVLSSVSPHPSD